MNLEHTMGNISASSVKFIAAMAVCVATAMGCIERKPAGVSAKGSSQSERTISGCEIDTFEEAFPHEKVTLFHGTTSTDFDVLLRKGINQDGSSDNFGDFGFGHYNHHGKDLDVSLEKASEWAVIRSQESKGSTPVVLEIEVKREDLRNFYGNAVLFNDLREKRSLTPERQTAWLDFMRKYGRYPEPTRYDEEGATYWILERRKEFIEVPHDLVIGPMYKSPTKNNREDLSDADYVPHDHEGRYLMQYVFYRCGLKLLNSAKVVWKLHTYDKEKKSFARSADEPKRTVQLTDDELNSGECGSP